MKESKNTIRSKLSKLIWALILPIILIFCWQLAYNYGMLPDAEATSPYLIWKTFVELLSIQKFWIGLGYTFYRVFTGVLIGAILGVLLGVFASTRDILNKVFSPMMHFFNGIPVVIWIPFWIMIFGVDDYFKIGLIAVTAFFATFVSVYQSVQSIDKNYVEFGRLYNKNYWTMVSKVYLPYSKYSLIGAIRASFNLAWVIIFFVEYSISFEGKEGIGWFIANARNVGRIDEEFTGLIILGLVAFACDRILNIFQKRSIVWKK